MSPFGERHGTLAIRVPASAAEVRARVEARRGAQLLVELPFALGERAGHHDVEHRVEIAGAAARLWQTFAGEAQLLRAFGSRWHLHGHATFQRRYFDLGAERGFPGTHRQLDLQVVGARLEEAMGLEHDLQVDVSRRPAVHAGAALAAQPQALAVHRAFRDARAQCLAVDLELALGAARRLFQRDAHRRLVVLARNRHVAAEAAAARPRAAEDAHLLEDIREIYVGQLFRAARAEAVEPVGRRPEILAGAEAAAEAVVGRALFL